MGSGLPAANRQVVAQLEKLVDGVGKTALDCWPNKCSSETSKIAEVRTKSKTCMFPKP